MPKAIYPLALLILTFALAFSLPLLVGLRFKPFGAKDSSTPLIQHDLIQEIPIRVDGNFIAVEKHEALTPRAGRDYLLTVWVKLKRVPQVGERIMFLTLTDPQSSEGLNLGLARDEDVMRPILSLKTPKGKGLISFAPLDVIPKNWFLLALSIHKGSSVGCYAAQTGLKARIDLLGGYDITAWGVPPAPGELQIGAFSQNGFRGSIGPVSIFSGRRFASKSKEIVKALVRNPFTVPEPFSEEDVVLWYTGGQSDGGPLNHKVSLVAPHKEAKEKKN